MNERKNERTNERRTGDRFELGVGVRPPDASAVAKQPFCGGFDKGWTSRAVAPAAAFRYLGAQVSPLLNWKKHSEKIKADLHKLTQQVVGAKPTWGPELLSVATVGKIMGTARFVFTFVPIQTSTVRQLDNRIAKALSSSHGFGYGISPWQVRQAPPVVSSTHLVQAHMPTVHAA